jgi:threonylcarbamoyladenosine tRNA methylthiotransferase MtaB
MAVEVVTFGCRLNAYESEAMQRHAEAAGAGDVVIVNTCAVTAEATRQARQTIRARASARRPHRGHGLRGAGGARDLRGDARGRAGPRQPREDEGRTWAPCRPPVGFGTERVVVDDIMAVRETAVHLIDGMRGRTRAFVQVQNGCDHRCTFCIIPFGRGNSRSVPMGAVVDQVRTSWSTAPARWCSRASTSRATAGTCRGSRRSAPSSRRSCATCPELERLRISSIDSVEADPDLLDAIATEPRLMPHLHLSLQAGDDMILKRMKRRHGRADAIAFCDEVRRLRPRWCSAPTSSRASPRRTRRCSGAPSPSWRNAA